MTSRFGDPLSTRERLVLELSAMEGLTYSQVARRMGTTLRSTEMTASRVRIKLGAHTMIHAVHIAMAAGILGVRPSCGTRGGVARHERYGEEMCVKCRIFWRPYRRGIKARARDKARSETKISGGGRVQPCDGAGSAHL